MSLEISLASSVFRPRTNIDLNFDMVQIFNKIQKITVSLILELKINTLEEPKIVVEHIEQCLGTETITKDDMMRNSDGKTMLHSFLMSKI